MARFCAWNRRGSGRSRNRITRAPSTVGDISLAGWNNSWRGRIDGHEGSHPKSVHSLDPRHLRRSHHRLYLQPVSGHPGLCSCHTICFPSRHAAVGIVDVEGPSCPAAGPEKTCLETDTMTKSTTAKDASRLIDGRIKELGDWRGEMLARLRALIKEADPNVEETWKWRGVPIWEHDGIICTGETYKSVVKMTFAKGAALKDPAGLFNSSLDGNTRRAIDFHEGDKINEKALKTLIRAAVALNTAKAKS